MRAALLEEFRTPLALRDCPRPEPAEDEVLIEVEASGVCHSDLHVADGDWKQLAGITKKPLIPGHEVVGRVIQKGGAAGAWQVGDRVGVPWLFWSCGTCEFCLGGYENLCRSQLITGVSVDGGYAEFLRARASHVERIPDNLSPVEAAPLFCAGVTVYRAIQQAGIQPGWRVGIFGVGGLGHLAVQIARALGAEVIAADIADEKLDLARRLGAAETVPATPDGVKALRRQGRVQVALVTSASKAAYDTAFSCLRPTGTLVVVGLPAENLSFPAISMSGGEYRVQGTAVGTREDLRGVLALAAGGKIRCQVTTHELERVNEVWDALRRGAISGRAVLQLR